MLTVKLPELLSYQKTLKDHLEDEEVKYVTFLKSRQTGGSFFNKWLVLRWSLGEAGSKIGYITPTYKLARLFYRELNASLLRGTLVKDKNGTDLLITFANGSTAQFFSAESKDSIRGFQFSHLIIDEAAFIKDEVYHEVLHATHLIMGKKVMMCSTPFLKGGFFHQHFVKGITERGKYRSEKVTIYDNPFVSREDIEDIRTSLPDRVFKQEYLSEFLDTDGSVFKDFKKCVKPGSGQLTGTYYVGIDWGKQIDATVVVVMNNKKEVMEVTKIKDLQYTEQVKKVLKILQKWNPKVTVSEENNAGTVINEMLEKEWKGLLDKKTLHNQNKKEMVEYLVTDLEQGNIRLREEDTELIEELGVFSANYNSTTKKVHYGAPTGFHDDFVLALCHCLSGINNHMGSYDIR